MPVPPCPGSQNAKLVWPTRTRSPSTRRRRPWIRSPLTKVPFWEKPSSHSGHSPALHSSSACSRETSGSHGSETSASVRRPRVSDSATGSSPTIRARRVVAEDEERQAALLGGTASLQIGRRRAVEGEWRVHHGLEKMLRSDTKMFTIETKMPVASQIASASVPCLRSTLKSTTISAADSR